MIGLLAFVRWTGRTGTVHVTALADFGLGRFLERLAERGFRAELSFDEGDSWNRITLGKAREACTCGACLPRWTALPFLGISSFDEDDVLELRNCPSCGSTLARVLAEPATA